METQSLETKSMDNGDDQNTNTKEEDKICDDIVKQVFEREDYINHDYYREFNSRFNHCTRLG